MPSIDIELLTAFEVHSARDSLRLLLERGAVLDDPPIAPVLLNDADGLAAALRADPSLIEHLIFTTPIS